MGACGPFRCGKFLPDNPDLEIGILERSGPQFVTRLPDPTCDINGGVNGVVILTGVSGLDLSISRGNPNGIRDFVPRGLTLLQVSVF